MYFLFVDTHKDGVEHHDLAPFIPGHIAWVEELMADGRMVQAGRWGDIGGAAIFKADSKDTVLAWLADDPLTASGLVDWRLEEFFPVAPLD